MNKTNKHKFFRAKFSMNYIQYKISWGVLNLINFHGV